VRRCVQAAACRVPGISARDPKRVTKIVVTPGRQLLDGDGNRITTKQSDFHFSCCCMRTQASTDALHICMQRACTNIAMEWLHRLPTSLGSGRFALRCCCTFSVAWRGYVASFSVRVRVLTCPRAEPQTVGLVCCNMCPRCNVTQRKDQEAVILHPAIPVRSG
jgi:hypothetical protein